MKRLALAMAALSCACAAFAADKPYLSTVGPKDPLPTFLVDPLTGLAVTPGASPSVATFSTGQARIATAGTAVCLPSSALVNGVAIKALAANTGVIAIGTSGVTAATDGTGNGFPLAAGEGVSLAVQNASVICFNGTTVGDGVSYAGN